MTGPQMRDQLSDLLNRTAHLRSPTLGTRSGKTATVLVSVENWEQYLQMKTTADTREAEGVGQTAGKKVSA